MAAAAIPKATRLWRAIVNKATDAQRKGHIFSIPSDIRTVEDAGIKFIVRVAAALKQKPNNVNDDNDDGESTTKKPFFDPFAEPRKSELFVGSLGRLHSLLLNKFNVVDHHLIVVTNKFHSQDEALDEDDFAACWACMRSIPDVENSAGMASAARARASNDPAAAAATPSSDQHRHGQGALMFFNSGSQSGASQPHKHMQVVPLPLARVGADLESVGARGVPVECPLLCLGGGDGGGVGGHASSGVRVSSKLPFTHAFVRLDARSMNLARGEEPCEADGASEDDDDDDDSPPGVAVSAADRRAGAYLRERYSSLLDHFVLRPLGHVPSGDPGGGGGGSVGGDAQGGVGGGGPSYNLLLSRRWMMVVPRLKSGHQGFGINGLGYTGTILLRGEEELDRLTSFDVGGPARVLRECAGVPAAEQAAA